MGVWQDQVLPLLKRLWNWFSHADTVGGWIERIFLGSLSGFVPGSVVGVLSNATWWHIGLIGFVIVHAALFFALAHQRGWFSIRTGLLFLLIPIAYWFGTFRVPEPGIDPVAGREEIPPEIVDPSFREDALRFIDLSVVPASEALKEAWSSAIALEEDELASQAFNVIRAQEQNARNIMLNSLNQEGFGEQLLVDQFCYFFQSYFDAFQWLHWIGERNAFDFSSKQYVSWKQYHVRYLDDLRDFMRDPRYEAIRTSCARELILKEMLTQVR